MVVNTQKSVFAVALSKNCLGLYQRLSMLLSNSKLKCIHDKIPQFAYRWS